jgi:hypothetical protein
MRGVFQVSAVATKFCKNVFEAQGTIERGSQSIQEISSEPSRWIVSGYNDNSTRHTNLNDIILNIPAVRLKNSSMSTEILSHVPRAQIYENFEQRFRDVFRAGNALLDTYHKSYDRLRLPHSEFMIDQLLTLTRDYHASALGYMLDHHYARDKGDERLARKSLKLASHKQAMALILADAADRANTFSGSPQNANVAEIVGFIQARARENPVNAETTSELLELFQSERDRGFQIPPPNSRLTTLIGDEGCPDTAEIMRITTAYRIPVDILIINERHTDRRGFRQSNDHAIALYEDMYGSPPIPLVVFPNDERMSEPTAHQFVKAFFENRMI